jgi:hypothetical protein
VTASEQSTGSNGTVGVLAISRDDQWAHVYEDERAAVGVSTFGRSGQDPSDIEFFDGTGRSLTPEYGPDGELTGLRPSSSPTDPEAVQRRLRAVIAYAGDYLRQQRADAGDASDDLAPKFDTAERQLPELEGGSLAEDLKHVRTILGPHPMDGDLQNRGSFFHNLFVHGMRT